VRTQLYIYVYYLYCLSHMVLCCYQILLNVSFQYVIFERTFHKYFVRTELYIYVFITFKVKG